NVNTSLWRQLGSFFRLGVEHIFIGYDHILFLLSLIVVCKFRELVKIVTSFTVAHTITLILATLCGVQLPGRLVESAIAATIVYVALENFWIDQDARRWRLTFAFGLIHGFGFAGVLRQLGLPTSGLVRSLVAFNVGVEAGQLAIVLMLFPLMAALAKWKHRRYARWILSGLIAACGLCWFIDRAVGLGFMPF
ncbi:MAG: HupE/UreJ family protein, partial [Planctomycetales bacterium]|nr:HupE/UreJ family protein [Planctomycetales bacterium]